MAAGAIAGCAVPIAGTGSADAQPVPAERQYAFQTCSVAECAQVTVIRDHAFLIGACVLALTVTRHPGSHDFTSPGKQLAARLEIGESVALQMRRGVWPLHVAADPQDEGLCRRTSARRPDARSSAEVDTILQAGQVKRVVLRMDQGGGMTLKAMDSLQREPGNATRCRQAWAIR